MSGCIINNQNFRLPSAATFILADDVTFVSHFAWLQNMEFHLLIALSDEAREGGGVHEVPILLMYSYCLIFFYDAGRPMRRMAELEHSRTCPQHLHKPRASIAARQQQGSSSRTSLKPNKRTRQSLKTISMSLLFDHEQQHTQKTKKKKKTKTILLSKHRHGPSSSRLFGRANETCQRLRPRQPRVLDPLAS